MSATSSGETASARASTSSVGDVRRGAPLLAAVVERELSRSPSDATERRSLAARRSAIWRAAEEAVGDHDEVRAGAVDEVGDLVAGVAGVGRHERAAGVGRRRAPRPPSRCCSAPQTTTRSPGSRPRPQVAAGDAPAPGRAARRRRAVRVAVDVRPGWSPYRSAAARRSAPGIVSLHSTSSTPTKQLLGRVAAVDLSYSAEDEAFRAEVRAWLARAPDRRVRRAARPRRPRPRARGVRGAARWNRHLAEHGWTCVGWPEEYGGRGLSLWQQVIFHEEYARADAPARVNHLGEELLGPTLIAFGTEEQKQRFLPRIAAVEELWARATPSRTPAPTWPTCRPRPGSTGERVGDRRPEGVDLQRPPGRLVLRGRPHRARLASATTGCPSCWCRWTRTASRSGRSSS